MKRLHQKTKNKKIREKTQDGSAKRLQKCNDHLKTSIFQRKGCQLRIQSSCIRPFHQQIVPTVTTNQLRTATNQQPTSTATTARTTSTGFHTYHTYHTIPCAHTRFPPLVVCVR